jgi:hypothetical protein
MGESSSNGRSSARELTSLTYRSRAVRPMSVPALRKLERVAKARNRAEGLTGFAVYDKGSFFQWLEGPTEAVARVWDSVSHDARHTDISDFKVRTTPSRVFAGSDMAIAIRGESTPLSIAPPLLALVSALDPLHAIAEGQPVPRWGKSVEVVPPVIPLLPVLVEALVLPQMFSKHGSVRRFLPPVSPAAASLAKLLVSDDGAPAATILRRLYASAGSLAPLCATIIEPVARRLGDLWLADDCSQLEMTAALGRLQAIVRRLDAAATPTAIGLPAVLVVTQPGEEHLLASSLDADLLWQAGWDTHHEFPETDHALQAMLSETWFDVLDLSLSPALMRADQLPLMAATIAGARLASRNPALTVVVGGRAFFEQCEATALVGADASTTSSFQIVLTATSAHEKTLTDLATRGLLVTPA